MNHCSRALSALYASGQMLANPIVQLITNLRSVSNKMIHNAMPMEEGAKAKEALVDKL